MKRSVFACAVLCLVFFLCRDGVAIPFSWTLREMTGIPGDIILEGPEPSVSLYLPVVPGMRPKRNGALPGVRCLSGSPPWRNAFSIRRRGPPCLLGSSPRGTPCSDSPSPPLRGSSSKTRFRLTSGETSGGARTSVRTFSPGTSSSASVKQVVSLRISMK